MYDLIGVSQLMCKEGRGVWRPHAAIVLVGGINRLPYASKMTEGEPQVQRYHRGRGSCEVATRAGGQRLGHSRQMFYRTCIVKLWVFAN